MNYYRNFPLFNSHIDLAHRQWKSFLEIGDIVIDATCGNGYDTLELATQILAHETGLLYALDFQSTAIELCKQKLSKTLSESILNRIHFIQGCHSIFPLEIQPLSVKLIVYNLGYLPGGNKTLTTQVQTTLLSVQKALDLLQEGGMISITCYPGHPAGKEEEDAIVDFSTGLNPSIWSSCHHRWINRKNAPSLLLIQKNLY